MYVLICVLFGSRFDLEVEPKGEGGTLCRWEMYDKICNGKWEREKKRTKRNEIETEMTIFREKKSMEYKK